MPAPRDLTGKRFGHLTVVRRLSADPVKGWLWECLCDCGTLTTQRSNEVPRRKSCGCFNPKKTHGLSNSEEYRIWTHMRQRCGLLPRGGENNYAGRGISVCAQWQRDFQCFLADMGPRPSPMHTLDRIDNDGDYAPDNCRWATSEEQANNRRTTLLIPHKGETKSLAEWCRIYGANRHTVWGRLSRGVPFDDAIKPIKRMAVTIDGETKPIPEWAEAIGIARVTAYRLHKKGRLIGRVRSARK